MNAWQQLNQTQWLLGLQTWADSPTEHVFGQKASTVGSGGSVIISDGPFDKVLATLRRPFCILSTQGFSADEEHPDIRRHRFSAILCTEVEGDPFGERAVMGGPRPAAGGQGSSRGRGLLEVCERAEAAFGRLTGADGCPAWFALTGAGASERQGTKVVSSCRYSVEAACTRQPQYDAPQNLVATAAGGGTVNLTWTLPPARWDRRLVILRRAAGSTAPASATAGTGVALSGVAALLVADTGLVPGTYSYAVFEAYTETGAAANERFSGQVTGTTRTVVAT